MKYFITSFFLIGSLYFNTISLYATNGRSFEEQTSKRMRSTATYHNKIKNLSKKIDTSTWGRPSHITVLGTLLLLAAHFQPVGVNQRSFTHSPTITSHGTIEASSDNLRTNNGTVCKVGARALGAKQAHIFTLLERHSSYSGHFIKDRNVTTVKEIKRERLKEFEQFAKNLVGAGKLSEEASQEEINQLYKERQPAFSRVYTFNGSPVDALYSQMIAQTDDANNVAWIKKQYCRKRNLFII